VSSKEKLLQRVERAIDELVQLGMELIELRPAESDNTYGNVAYITGANGFCLNSLAHLRERLRVIKLPSAQEPAAAVESEPALTEEAAQ